MSEEVTYKSTSYHNQMTLKSVRSSQIRLMLFKWMISTLLNNSTKILIFLLTLLNKSSTIIYVVRSSKKQSINNEIIYFLEEYPSLVEGVGLENRKGCQSPRGFESLFLLPKRKP